MSRVEYLLASKGKLKNDLGALLRILRSKPVRTIYEAKKNGQTYKLILNNGTLIQIWKFPTHLQAKNQFLSKKKAHIRKGWQGITKFVERSEREMEALEKKKVRGEIPSSRKDLEKSRRYVKILGRKILLN
jgi:hypothetical protein